jgi:hypothetical protein
VDSHNCRTRPAPLVEQSTSSDFITRIFRERLQRAAASIQRSGQNPTTNGTRAASNPQPQPIPAQQQHGPVLPDSTNQYFKLSTATGRVFKHTVRDTAKYFDNTINSKGSIETESMQVRIEYQGRDRQCYWRLYTETITNNRTTHFIDDGIEPIVD